MSELWCFGTQPIASVLGLASRTGRAGIRSQRAALLRRAVHAGVRSMADVLEGVGAMVLAAGVVLAIIAVVALVGRTLSRD